VSGGPPNLGLPVPPPATRPSPQQGRAACLQQPGLPSHVCGRQPAVTRAPGRSDSVKRRGDSRRRRIGESPVPGCQTGIRYRRGTDRSRSYGVRSIRQLREPALGTSLGPKESPCCEEEQFSSVTLWRLSSVKKNGKKNGYGRGRHSHPGGTCKNPGWTGFSHSIICSLSIAKGHLLPLAEHSSGCQ
jgi:hypothetical protein